MIELKESKIYDFEEFRLDAKSHRLFRRATDELVSLPPKAVEVLIYLVENAGRIISKEELIEKVWENSFVEDSNLTQTIFVLRKALGEDKKKPRFILTAPHHGYQFIAAVKQFRPEDEILEESFLSDASQVQSPKSKVQSPKTAKLVWLAIPVVLLIAFGIYWFYPKPKPVALNEIKTLAVLPFEDLSEGQTEKYLGASLAEALVNKFGHLKQITVRPTRSTMKYSESREDLSKIGRELQVDAVLDGRIQRIGEKVRVSVQLVRTSDNATIWAETFDDNFTNFFAVQDSISQKVVKTLALQMGENERERFNRKGTENAEAYQDYLRGVFFREKRINDNLTKAAASFEQAIQKDPNFALAYAELGYCHLIMPEYMGTPTSESFPKAKEYATKALELDDQIAEAHLTLTGLLRQEGDFAGGEKELARTLELNPNNVTALRWKGMILGLEKRYDEALAQFRRASEIDPTSTVIMNNIAQNYKAQGNYDAAIEELNKALLLDPNAALTHDELARVLYKKGLYKEALPESLKAVDLSNRLHTLLVTLGEIYIKLDEREKAIAVIKELEEKYPSAASYYISYLYAQYGDKEKMYEWLERAMKEKPRDLNKLNTEPSFAPFRNEPRFQNFVQRAGV